MSKSIVINTDRYGMGHNKAERYFSTEASDLRELGFTPREFNSMVKKPPQRFLTLTVFNPKTKCQKDFTFKGVEMMNPEEVGGWIYECKEIGYTLTIWND